MHRHMQWRQNFLLERSTKQYKTKSTTDTTDDIMMECSRSVGVPGAQNKTNLQLTRFSFSFACLHRDSCKYLDLSVCTLQYSQYNQNQKCKKLSKSSLPFPFLFLFLFLPCICHLTVLLYSPLHLTLLQQEDDGWSGSLIF